MNVDFIYYFEDRSGRFYYLDDNKNVQVTNQNRFIENSPDGWVDQVVNYGRNDRFPGVLRSFTIPLRFPKSDAHILRSIYFQQGSQAFCRFRILMLDRKTQVYNLFYAGEIDFTQKLDQENFFQVNVMEGGLVELITANEGVTYEIPLEPEAYDVLFDGIQLKGSTSYLTTNGVSTLDLHGNHLVDLSSIGSDGSQYILGTKDEVRTRVPDFTGPTVAATKQSFLQPNVDQSVKFDYDLELRITHDNTAPLPSPGIAYSMDIRVQQGDTVYSDTQIYTAIGPDNVYGPAPYINGKTHVIIGNTNVFVPKGAQVYLLSFVTVFGSTGDALTTFDYDYSGHTNTFVANNQSRFPTTTVKMLSPLYVFRQLISKITSGSTDYLAQSTLLDGSARMKLLTCGDALRGITVAVDTAGKGAVLKTSLSDFTQSYRTVTGGALGISGNVASFEGYESFFDQSDEIVDMGTVVNYQSSPALDHIFNSIKIGYPEQDYDDVNGKDEFNNTYQFTTPMTKVKKQLDLTSVYRGDGYGAEFERINLDGKKTTDSSGDNDIWIIDVHDESVISGDIEIHHYTLNRPAYSSITGTINPETVINTQTTPMHCLLANGAYIRSGMWRQEQQKLVFQTTEKNAALSTTLNGVTITENADVLIGSLPAPLFIPELFKFDCAPPHNVAPLIEQRPYGKIAFTWLGNKYYGYIIGASQEPSLDNKQNYTLLATSDNDLSTLVY